MTMKKIYLAILLIAGTFGFANAQINHQHALGLRLGDNANFGTEISYQYTLTPMTRLEADLGVRSGNSWNSWAITGVHQWVWHIDGGFNWYAGAGAGIGSWSYRNNYTDYGDSGLFLTIAGTAGIEYNFEIPLQVAIDTRPQLGFINPQGDNLNLDLALSVRYCF
ncbi:hypothetical protein PbJCM13498_08530 [Prolixibacter bellariivorans]|uniref:Outer membrane protein beta-barrel domain-containing protein n=2 Tax=Prolixibacter bellariivorans TaxID=314319 RepID=A0A5M4AVN0_9BACT|nr:hypothetical protein PbJCM13498_08530 [Prolixibacter bellariivorans]